MKAIRITFWLEGGRMREKPHLDLYLPLPLSLPPVLIYYFYSRLSPLLCLW